MRALLLYLALYCRHGGQHAFGILRAIITLLASSVLLTLSGWFLVNAAASVAGAGGNYSTAW